MKVYAKREKAVMWEVYDAGRGTATMLDGRPPDELEEDETDEAIELQKAGQLPPGDGGE
jgi:hypothetical protein